MISPVRQQFRQSSVLFVTLVVAACTAHVNGDLSSSQGGAAQAAGSAGARAAEPSAGHAAVEPSGGASSAGTAPSAGLAGFGGGGSASIGPAGAGASVGGGGMGTNPAAGASGGENPTAPATGSSACGGTPVGYVAGMYAPNFALKDEHGAVVHLSDYCDKVVWLDMGAMWCPACKRIAQEDVEPWFQERKARGLFVLSVMAETARREDPAAADLLGWKTTYGLSTPVLADPGWQTIAPYTRAAGHTETNWTPWAVVILPGGKISVSRGNAWYQHLDWALSDAGL